MRSYYLTHRLNRKTGLYDRRFWVKWNWVPLWFKLWVARNWQPITDTPPWQYGRDRQPVPGVYRDGQEAPHSPAQRDLADKAGKE